MELLKKLYKVYSPSGKRTGDDQVYMELYQENYQYQS